MTITELYGGFPKASQNIRARRLRLLGHCIKRPDEITSDLALWQPSQGRLNRGRKRATYIDNLLKDTNMRRIEELPSLIINRDIWKIIVHKCNDGTG